MHSQLFKSIVLCFGMLGSHAATASPVHALENERTSCNQQGYFFDAAGHGCTASKLDSSCDASSLERVVKSRGGSPSDWISTHQQLSQKGFKIAQCSLDNEVIRVGYVKKGIVIRYQTVTFQ